MVLRMRLRARLSYQVYASVLILMCGTRRSDDLDVSGCHKK